MTASPPARTARVTGFTTRVFGAMGLVVAAGAATLLVVASLISPVVYRRRLEHAGVNPEGPVGLHVQESFRNALLTGVLAGVVAAIIVSAGLAVMVSRRLVEPVDRAADAADQLAQGDYTARIEMSALGPEVERLGTAINSLARRLESTEEARLRLLTDLTHELRTPLTSIIATVEAVNEGILPADPQTLQVLRDQSARLARLIDDLAAVSRADEHAFRMRVEPIDLSSCARDAAAAAGARYAAGGVALDVEAGEPVAARADHDRVIEVLDQLLDNAFRQCAAGDRVTIQALKVGGRARLLVSDTGNGFDPAEAEAIFSRFHRGTRPSAGSGTGSGIGLTIARALVEAQDGRLTAASAGPGAGATFTIDLPAA